MLSCLVVVSFPRAHCQCACSTAAPNSLSAIVVTWFVATLIAAKSDSTLTNHTTCRHLLCLHSNNTRNQHSHECWEVGCGSLKSHSQRSSWPSPPQAPHHPHGPHCMHTFRFVIHMASIAQRMVHLHMSTSIVYSMVLRTTMISSFTLVDIICMHASGSAQS